VDIGVHFYATLLFPGLGMPAYAFENEVGKKAYCRGVDNLQAVEPCGHPPFSAVRGKFVLVSGVQAAVRGLKHGLRPAGVGIRQSATPWHRPYAQMGELARFRKHRISNLAQCVEFSDDSVKHYGHMLVGIKALYVAFTIILAAEFENFFLVEQIY
jgi:hypothetical protein